MTNFLTVKKMGSALIFLALLLLGQAAQAATNYVFSPLDRALDVLPAGCTFADTTAYTCATGLTLADDDTITIKGSPLAITFGGVFTTGKRNLINDGGASALTFITNAVFNLGEGSRLKANVVATAAVNLGDVGAGANNQGATLDGSLTTTGSAGIVTVGNDIHVTGDIHTIEAAVTVMNRSTVGGSVGTQFGAVVVLDASTVSGSISTEGGGDITVGNASTVGGNIRTGVGDGAVTLKKNVTLVGGITTGAGTITVDDGSTIGGAITCTRAGIVILHNHITVTKGISTQAGGVSMWEYNLIGRPANGGPAISTLAGGVTVWPHSVIDGAISTQAGIVTLWSYTTVNGNIATGAGGISIDKLSSICGDIYSASGVVTLTQGIKVGGSVGTGVGTITIGMTGVDVSTVGGNVASAAALTLTKVWVGGNVTAEGAATLTDSRVRGTLVTGATCNNCTSGDTGSDLIFLAACNTTGPVTSTPAGAFECLETGLLAGSTWIAEASTANTTHRLYTKLAGTAFAFDVVALKTDGTVETNYVATGGAAKSVTLELVDGTGSTACDSRASIAAGQPISFAAADAGRKSASLTLNQAYANLRCRVTDTNPTPSVVACSSDNFAVRPASATLVTTATALAPSASATPAIKAGATFSLSVTTNPGAAYAGTLTLDTSKLTAQTSAQDSSKVNGGVVGLLTPALLIANAGAVTASYSEVGYLYLAPGAFRNDSFTAIDSGAGDCITAAVDSANYLSDTVVGSTGKYGCSIGNKIGVSLGRFYPDHFVVTPPVFTPACGTSASDKSFTYMGQLFVLKATVEAQSLGNAKTQNFSGVFAQALVVPEIENANNGVAMDKTRLPGQGSPVWTSGAYAFVANGFGRGTAPDGPFDSLDIGLQVTSTAPVQAGAALPVLINRNMAEVNTSCTPDNPGQSDGTCTATRIATEAKMRYGRLKLSNAYGSARQDLKLPVTLQYWTAQGWQTNTLDVCSMSQLSASHFAFEFSPVAGKNTLTACNTALTLNAATPYALNLSAPGAGKTGWADITLNLGAAQGSQCSAPGASGPAADTASMVWLQYGGTAPKARATFGVFKSPLIYRRENF